MGELTDEDLVDIEQRIGRGLCYRCDGLKYEQPGPSCPACDGTGMFALSTTVMLLIITELRERRAQDLTSEETESLIDAQRCVRFHCSKNDKHHVAALAVLSKLLTRGNR